MIKRFLALGGTAAALLGFYIYNTIPSPLPPSQQAGFSESSIEKIIADENAPAEELDLGNKISSLNIPTLYIFKDSNITIFVGDASLNPEAASSKKTSRQAYASNNKSYSQALGHPAWGGLKNPAEVKDGEYVKVVHPRNRYGTEELVNTLTASAGVVYEKYGYSDGGPQLEVYDLSKKQGGKLGTHLSHRNGRDADVGIYRQDGEKYNNKFLPLGRSELNDETMDINWNFIKALQQEYPLEFILWSYTSKMHDFVLRKYGEEEWGHYGKVLRAARGHRDHFHIRIADPEDEKAKKLQKEIPTS